MIISIMPIPTMILYYSILFFIVVIIALAFIKGEDKNDD